MAIEFIDARKGSSGEALPTNEQIREIRNRLGWSQELLASKMTKHGLPISQTEISVIERGGESEPTKFGYKETRDPTRSWFEGKGYHTYRERIKLFFMRNGVIFIDNNKILISSSEDLFSPFASALYMIDFGEKPVSDTEINERRKEYEDSIGRDLTEVARWVLSGRFIKERDDYAKGENSIDLSEIKVEKL